VDQSNHANVASANLSAGKASATIAADAVSTVAGRSIVTVYSGDTNFLASTSAPLPAITNSAAKLPGGIAPNEIVSLWNVPGLTGDTAGSTPLSTSLGGVSVKVTDSAGASRQSLLYGVFASAEQINFIVPAGTAAGLATVTVTLPGGGAVTTMIVIAGSAPGLFTTTMTAEGPFAGQILYVHAGGLQTFADSTQPIQLGVTGDQVFLVLYRTGIRNAAAVTATVGGVALPVAYSGAQNGYEGLDQINVGPLPSSLVGSGSITIAIVADGQAANPVSATVQ
jgi:uncharacterized protein (TIGR03437 family)